MMSDFSINSIVSKLLNDEKLKLFLFGQPIEDVDLICKLIESGDLLDGNNIFTTFKFNVNRDPLISFAMHQKFLMT